jgi:hypothetical protein
MATYLPAAVLVRSMDAGATVGVVLMCSASRMPSPLRTAGLLGAALTGPHVLGFLGAPVLDRARDKRRVVGVAAGAFAALLAVAAWGLSVVPLPVVFALCLGAGAVGPMLTGGLSSLVDANGGDEAARRRRALDALTYGVAGAAAPALVAVLASLLAPRVAVFVLCALGAVGGGLVTILPSNPRRGDGLSAPRQCRSPFEGGGSRPVTTRPPGTWSGLSAIWREPRLRQVAVLTWVAAFVVAAALLAGMALGERVASGGGGWVAAAFGAGGLVGGGFLTARPLRIEPARGMLIWVAMIVPVLAVEAVASGSLPLLLATFATMGLVVAPQTVLSLAARGEYAPANVRGTVFVTVAGTKVAFSSAGTAVAGLTVGLPQSHLLAWLGAVTVGAVAVAALSDG